MYSKIASSMILLIGIIDNLENSFNFFSASGDSVDENLTLFFKVSFNIITSNAFYLILNQFCIDVNTKIWYNVK